MRSIKWFKEGTIRGQGSRVADIRKPHSASRGRVFVGGLFVCAVMGTFFLHSTYSDSRNTEKSAKAKQRRTKPVTEGRLSQNGKWMIEEVPYISDEDEKVQFPKLTTDMEREQFIKEFWERRNPNPGSPDNKFKDEYYKRLAYAKEHYHYLITAHRDDRARVYIQFGGPDKIDIKPLGLSQEHPNAGEKVQASSPIVERWTYGFIEDIGKNVLVDFADPSRNGEYHVVVDPLTLIDHTPSAALRQLRVFLLCDSSAFL